MGKIIFLIWFFLPTGFANIAPVFASKIPVLKKFSYPLDFYQKFAGKRIFGDHKTYRGLFSALVVAIVISYIQKVIYVNNPEFIDSYVTEYSQVNPIIFGFLSGLGTILGDAAKSFFKRQNNIPPGQAWFPFDQVDYVTGSILLTSLYATPNL